jgi:DNA-binding NarL/FixJ family response regulator
LSERELQVLSLIVTGQTCKHIAQRLGLSDLTVRKHRENLMRKAGAANTAQLVARHALLRRA